MKRARPNRRKRQPPKLPAMPKIRINWRALLVPPALIAALVMCVHVGTAWVDRPVTGLIVEGEFQRVRPIQIEAALGSIDSLGFFTLDLDSLRAAVAAIDWVDTVEIRRVWPGQLHVSITEHRAAASWGETGLLNTRGELFTENARFEYAELPKLRGPSGSEQRLAGLYLELRSRLTAANLTLTTLEMDDRGALTFGLAGGQEVRLGRDAHGERLERFFTVATPTLEAELSRVRYIDLRYPNGFAVGWLEPAPPAAATRVAKADTDA